MSLLLVITIAFCSCAGEGKNESIPANARVAAQAVVENEAESLTICSFNIQFLGHFKNRDDTALSKILEDYDIVVVQELVAPPCKGKYPDDTEYEADVESKEFFDEMKSLGFKHVLSEENTGTNDEIHKATSATEWWVFFYKPDKVKEAEDLPSGFVSLKDECVPTNTNVNNPKPYDYVMHNSAYTAEIDFEIINIIDVMKSYWEQSQTGTYPDDPYDHDSFRRYYSDRHPVLFRMIVPENDNDFTPF